MKNSKAFIGALIFLLCTAVATPCFAATVSGDSAIAEPFRYSDIRSIVGDFTIYHGVADFAATLVPNPSSEMDTVRFTAELKDAAGGVHRTWNGTVMINENGVFIMEGTEELWLIGDYHVSIEGECYANGMYLESFSWASRVCTYY